VCLHKIMSESISVSRFVSVRVSVHTGSLEKGMEAVFEV